MTTGMIIALLLFAFLIVLAAGAALVMIADSVRQLAESVEAGKQEALELMRSQSSNQKHHAFVESEIVELRTMLKEMEV